VAGREDRVQDDPRGVAGPRGTVGATACAAALLAIIGVAAWWRLAHLGSPGLWLDEILGVLGVGPEHGQGYYALMRATRQAAPNEALTRLPFALAGLLAIAAAFATGRALSGPWVGTGAAALLAASPIHIYYSREARPYALLVLCGFVGLYGAARAVRGGHSPFRALPILLAATAAAILVSANGAFVVAAVLVAAAWAWPATWPGRLAWLPLMGAITAAPFAIARVAYPIPGGSPDAIPTLAQVWDAARPLIGPLVSGHREMAEVPTLAWLVLGTVVAGAVVLGWRAPRPALGLLASTLIGLLLPVAVTVWMSHRLSARYALGALPGLCLLAASPLALLDRSGARWTRDGRVLVAAAVALVAVLGLGQERARRLALGEKADWRRVVAAVVERTSPGDLVLASTDWAHVCLDYYLPKGDAARQLVNLKESRAEGERLVATVPRALLVTGGAHVNYEAAVWMRTFPAVFTSGREDITVAFYPDRPTYIATVVTPAEVAADEARLRGMLRARVDMSVNADRFLLEGFRGPEVYGRDTPFRWADARSSIYLPVASHPPARLKTRARPHPALTDRRFAVWLNGVPLAEITLGDPWLDVDVAIPRSYLKTGANLLEFRTPGAPAAPLAPGAVAIQGVSFE
jgi:mannosyltransferase